MTDDPSDPPIRKDRVDPELIRRALEEQARNRPPRTPALLSGSPPNPRVRKKRRNRRKP